MELDLRTLCHQGNWGVHCQLSVGRGRMFRSINAERETSCRSERWEIFDQGEASMYEGVMKGTWNSALAQLATRAIDSSWRTRTRPIEARGVFRDPRRCGGLDTILPIGHGSCNWWRDMTETEPLQLHPGPDVGLGPRRRRN